MTRSIYCMILILEKTREKKLKVVKKEDSQDFLSMRRPVCVSMIASR